MARRHQLGKPIKPTDRFPGSIPATAPDGTPAPKRADDRDVSWFTVDTDDVYVAVNAHTRRLIERLQNVFINHYMWRQLYNDMMSNFAMNTPMSALPQMQQMAGLSHNIVLSGVKSVASQVFNDAPRVRIVTENGNGKLQRQAKKLTQFCDGLLEEAELRLEAPRAGINALVCGTGYLHVYNDGEGNPCVDSVWPNDVLVDPIDGRGMHPTEMFLCGRASKENLCAQYPELADKIRFAAPGPSSDISRYLTTVVQNVGIVEAWKLPSTPGAKDGRHCVTCSTCTLFDEVWDLAFFPVFPIRWDEDQLSFWGIGICQQGFSQQMYINEMLNYSLEFTRQTSMARVAVEEGSLPPEAQMSNPGGILTYAAGSNPPQSLNLPPLDPTFYQNIANEHDWFYKLIGCNEQTVAATAPLGPGASGAAQRELRDNQSLRLSAFTERWNRLHTDVTKAAIELTRRFAAQNGGFGKKVRGKQFLGSITWADCNIDADAYTLQAFATGDLPRTPAGRIQKVTELAQAGALNKETMMQLLDMPDVDAETDRLTANGQWLNLIFERILDDHKYTPPDEYLMSQDMAQIVLSVTRNEMLLARLNDEDPECIALIDQFYNACIDEYNRAVAETAVKQQNAMVNAQAANPPPPPPPPAMAAQPAAPPVNRMLPQTANQQVNS
jgi:hypothetical protein